MLQLLKSCKKKKMEFVKPLTIHTVARNIKEHKIGLAFIHVDM